MCEHHADGPATGHITNALVKATDAQSQIPVRALVAAAARIRQPGSLCIPVSDDRMTAKDRQTSAALTTRCWDGTDGASRMSSKADSVKNALGTLAAYTKTQGNSVSIGRYCSLAQKFSQRMG